jgi:formiminotetrahydrofolate cyclodeaminase
VSTSPTAATGGAGDRGAFSAMALPHFLDAVAAPTPAPGGGTVAALSVALAAALTAMAARLSQGHAPDADQVAAQCVGLRDRAVSLGDEDAVVYGEVIAAHRHGRDDGDAMSAAADVPLAVAECGERVAHLAGALCERGNPALRGDARTAALLAAAGAEAAAVLVGINLAAHPDDGRVRRAEGCAHRARQVAAGAR